MQAVLAKLERGDLDTNVSVDAVTGMEGVADALAAVEARTSGGKIVVYPALHEMGMLRLSELPERLPGVAAALRDGRWTRAAEEALLASVGAAGAAGRAAPEPTDDGAPGDVRPGATACPATRPRGPPDEGRPAPRRRRHPAGGRGRAGRRPGRGARAGDRGRHLRLRPALVRRDRDRRCRPDPSARSRPRGGRRDRRRAAGRPARCHRPAGAVRRLRDVRRGPGPPLPRRAVPGPRHHRRRAPRVRRLAGGEPRPAARRDRRRRGRHARAARRRHPRPAPRSCPARVERRGVRLRPDRAAR